MLNDWTSINKCLPRTGSDDHTEFNQTLAQVVFVAYFWLHSMITQSRDERRNTRDLIRVAIDQPNAVAHFQWSLCGNIRFQSHLTIHLGLRRLHLGLFGCRFDAVCLLRDKIMIFEYFCLNDCDLQSSSIIALHFCD